MTTEEASERFNALPKEHRITIIGNEINMHIRWLEEEKRFYVKQHQANLKRINDRIKAEEKWLKDIKD
jgi:hypothetical protein